MLLRIGARALVGRCGHQPGWRWASASAQAEEPVEEAEGEVEEEFDRNKVSTAMRACETRHEVAEYMLGLDVATIADMHDLEASRMFANMSDSPLTSQCGRVLDAMSTRMKSRFAQSDSEKRNNSALKLSNIVKGTHQPFKKKEKEVWSEDMKSRRKKKASGSVNTYLEFASNYAQVYYAYARARGGGRRISESAKQNPLYVLAKDTTEGALKELTSRAKTKGAKIDRPETVPTAILAMGLLGLRYQWKNISPYVLGTGALSQKETPFMEWVHGSERRGGWDIEELASVLWGCMEMDLHKSADTRRFIEVCLQRAASEELLTTVTPTTLAQILRVASELKDTHGPLAEATKTLFANAEKRITALADPEAETLEYQALPPTAAQSVSNEVVESEGPDSTHEADRIKIERYDDPKYLIGSLNVGLIIEVIESYNATGRTASHVHAAAAGRIVSCQELRALLNDRPDAAVDIMWRFTGAYSKPLYDVLCAPLSNAEVWNELQLLDLHRVLVALHQSEYPSRFTVFAAVEHHLMDLLSKGGSKLSPAELSSLRTVLTKVGIDNDELYSLLDDMAIGS
eukprot:TRINITY_DN17531_c0_g1_i1.p1 TRINITY_DN17531_c0_g1~~TRINITY_DN17531_c0_g1_i1.p1  ORF type:complete len:573 (+),score=206.46 TRINITY_DN17531_c0_g1_i1:58-1776(+)